MPLLLVWLTGVVEFVTEKTPLRRMFWVMCSTRPGGFLQLSTSSALGQQLGPLWPLSLPVPSISPRVDLADGSVRAPVPSDRCGVPTGQRTNRL